ncbi:hypothetical protein [Demequina sp.]|uniref:hypothetical protein n=1 Tax=Demequina sp. TaxID=2050685 RepID=UPI003D0EA873
MSHEVDAVLERRTVITAAAWSAPAILIAQGVPALSASGAAPLQQSVIAVRATGPNWESTTQANLTPGFRFGSTVTAQVDLTITKTGSAATLAELFTVYDSVPWSTGLGNNWVATANITSAKTLGITIKAIDKAVGTYTATIRPHGSTVAAATAVFTVYRDGTIYKVRNGA